MDIWQPDYLEKNGIFSHLKELITPSWSNWPELADIKRAFEPNIKNTQGSNISFISQDAFMADLSVYYEARIYLKGEVPTRPENWHDFFGAIIWWLFPQTKVQINAQHMEDIKRYGQKQRTPRRDRLTHFDECGLVVACCEPELVTALRNHEWQKVFVDNRSAWGHSIDAFVLGHAIYETALSPYSGFTGKLYPVKVEKEFFQLSLSSQYSQLDDIIARQLEELDPLAEKGMLTPLPVLGVPGWWEENACQHYYRDLNYFCPYKGEPRMLPPAYTSEK